MKKRKELNALIGLGSGSGERGSGSGGGGGGSRKKKHLRKSSSSGHRLLRTESAESSSSSSSDLDYGDGFGLPGTRSRFAKSDYVRCCKFCYPLCAFVILAACVVACVGLVWMQVALKEDLDVLKERFRTMESNQKSSIQEIPRLSEDLLSKQKHLEKIESGDKGLNKIWVNITEISKQISILVSAVNHLKANIKSASDLINLPITVEELQKSVATIGSTVTSVHHDVETLQAAIEEHEKSIETLKTDMENQYLHTSLEEVNTTLILYQKQNDLRLFGMDSAVNNLSWRVASLENHMEGLSKLEKKENLSLSVVGDLTTSVNSENEPRNETTTANTQNLEKTENGDSQVSKLREKLQLINDLTSKPESDTSEATKKDLQELFRISNQGTDGKLTYKDLQNLVGITLHDSQSFKEFDTDGDEKYSLPELRAALGV
uniref:Uncharacterized protein n=1 Tax=Sphaerodactylus townsendi TaxID=933632 RepID=A0ACB8F4F5_9SAUR